jgi:hypothetical protein
MWQREGHNPLLIGLSSETLSKTTHRNVRNGQKTVSEREIGVNLRSLADEDSLLM